MVDRELLEKMLEELHRQVAFLRQASPPTVAELLADRLDYSGILYELQTAIQRVLDIGAHLLAAETGATPDEYRAVLHRLGDCHIIPPSFAERIAPMAGFRNILVHEYAEVDPVEVHRILQEGLDDLDQFAALVYQYIKKREEASDGTHDSR